LQNTSTGKLTEKMFLDIFLKANNIIHQGGTEFTEK
jgi:hypothetical protein